MADDISVRADTEAVEADIRRRIAGLLALPIALEEEAEQAKLRIIDLTARSDLSGRHMADQWFVKVLSKGGRKRGAGGKFIKGGGHSNIHIEIDHPANVVGAKHPSRKNSDGTPVVVNDGDHSLLATIEWGSKAHVIRAKTAFNVRGRGRRRSGLTFKDSRDGSWVTTQSVNHPGTRAFGMVRIVSRELNRDVEKRVQDIVSGRR